MKTKRFLLILVCFVLTLSMLASCKFGGGKKEDETEDKGEVENLIFNSETKIQIVIGEGVSEDVQTKFYDSIYNMLINTPDIKNDSSEAVKHEVIIGKSQRPVSVEAYRRLDRMVELLDKDSAAYLIYSDGSSVAVAYTEDRYGISLAADFAHEKLISLVNSENSLILAEGTAASSTFNVYDEQKKIDEKVRDEQWKALAEALGEHGDAIVAAFKDMYSMYSLDMIHWFANLYDPAVGGYYYSNSGRDTEGYLPDI